jgi:tryptophanyl-tRNA synthetase
MAMGIQRMLTGDRPTGRLHLGHYVGTLKNRVRYQVDFESFFLVADLHMLTTRNSPEDIAEIDTHAHHLVLDALAAGIEPERVTFYLQSGVLEIHEMYTLLQNLVSVARLERLPSLKEMARDASIDMPFGLLGYPVLQSADIFSVRAHLVPVARRSGWRSRTSARMAKL